MPNFHTGDFRLASELPPDIALEAQGVNQRQRIADFLLQQGLQPIHAPEVKGRFQGRISPWQGVAQLAKTGAGAFSTYQNQKAMKELAERERTQYDADLAKIPGFGAPAPTAAFDVNAGASAKADARYAVADALAAQEQQGPNRDRPSGYAATAPALPGSEAGPMMENPAMTTGAWEGGPPPVQQVANAMAPAVPPAIAAALQPPDQSYLQQIRHPGVRKVAERIAEREMDVYRDKLKLAAQAQEHAITRSSNAQEHALARAQQDKTLASQQADRATAREDLKIENEKKREQRTQEIETKLADTKTGREEANALRKEIATMQNDTRLESIAARKETMHMLAGGKPPTESQARANLFATRAEEAHNILMEADKSGKALEDRISTTGLATKRGMENVPLVGGALGAAANTMLSPEQQKVEQAQRNFVNAALRVESGAVIAESEFKNAIRQYFPQPGDSKEVIEQKRKNRQTEIEGLKTASGPLSKAPAATGGGGWSIMVVP